MSEGWFSDPTGRHESRYRDGDGWTAHVSDGGRAGTDPLPPEAQRPFGCRDTCQHCGGRDLHIVQVGGTDDARVFAPTQVLGMNAVASIRDAITKSLLCYDCGALHPFLPPASLAAAKAAIGDG